MADEIEKLRAEIEKLRAENERLRAALEPFAKAGKNFGGWQSISITVGDLRRASAALEGRHD
jgi:hypothetical protein